MVEAEAADALTEEIALDAIEVDAVAEGRVAVTVPEVTDWEPQSAD